jgi:signal transduction histidine kinase
LLNLFTYTTPPKFAINFKESYSHDNLLHVRTLSLIFFCAAFLLRVISLIFYKDIIKIANYSEHSLTNWIQLCGAFVFYLSSTIAIRSATKVDLGRLKWLTLCFIVFILLSTFSVSYIISLHNTKNTLTMFLIGIVTVSLFFVVEYKTLLFLAGYVVTIFVVSMVLPRITMHEKIMNVIASFILASLLVSFSRYSYYFKSQHFVKVMELKEKNLEIERLNNQKSDILSFVAHDLRNPLNNIEALSHIMLFENEQNAEAKMISTAVLQAKAIINDLIEAVKSDASALQTEKLDIKTYLSGIIEKWTSNQKRKIIFDDTEILATVQINASKLERVIDNLISNALKFSPPEQPIVIGLIDYSTHLCITVLDQGIGIPSNLQQYIFSQFSIAGRKGLKGEKSLGLGLHISKKIIEQHKGQLTFESREGKGTTFTILLPIV